MSKIKKQKHHTSFTFTQHSTHVAFINGLNYRLPLGSVPS